jgi:hypothetical protein
MAGNPFPYRVQFKLSHRHCELRSSEAIQDKVNYELQITGN